MSHHSRSWPDPRHYGPRNEVCPRCGKIHYHSGLYPACFDEYIDEYKKENWGLDINDEYHLNLPKRIRIRLGLQ